MQSVYWKLSSSRVVKGSRLASCACAGKRFCNCEFTRMLVGCIPDARGDDAKQSSRVCRLYTIS